MTELPVSVPTLTTSSAIYIQQPRFVMALRALWLVCAVLTVVMVAASIPLTFDILTTLCNGANCPALQLTAGSESALHALGLSLNFYAGIIVLAEVLVLSAYMGVGSMIFWRKPLDIMVVVFSFITVTWVVIFMPTTVYLIAVSSFWNSIKLLSMFAGGVLGMAFMLIFPDGRFFPRWTRWYFLLLAGILALSLFSSDNQLLESLSLLWNARAIPPAILAFLLAMATINAAVMVHRYSNVMTAVQRQQTKWVIVGLETLFAVGFSFLLGMLYLFPELVNPANDGYVFYALFALIIFSILLTLFPVTVMFSALRYRLWDVDIVLNRTLVYGLVTLALVVIFALGLIVVRSVLTLIVGTEQTGIALGAASALAAVAFNPLRKRVQNLVDVHIYGFRFDLNALNAAQKLPQVEHPGALTGRKLGDFTVLDFIGKGGMGEVYKGRGSSGQTVALKILPDDLAQQEQFRKRFQREAETLTALNHPNVVRIIGADSSDGIAYLAMEYIDGEELGRKLKAAGALSPDDSADILKGLAAALDYAHEKGFIHRDIKPSNVMLRRSRDNEIWDAILMDFGVAKVREAQSSLTNTGAIGTIDYMAPEQIVAAADVDRRADIYALGVVAYEMLTGERPFKGSAGQILFAHLQQPPPDPRDIKPDLPLSLAQAVMQALAKKPDERFQTAGAFAAAFG